MEALIKREWDAGHSASEISAELNRQHNVGATRNAVIGKLHRMGHRHTKLPTAPKVAKRVIRARKEFSRGTRQSSRNIIGNAKAVRAALPEMTVVKEIDPALHVDLMTIGDHQCHWPITDELYCGAAVISKRKPYCSIHSKIGKGSYKSRDPDAAKYVAKPTRGKYF